jgi:hypothetical protein
MKRMFPFMLILLMGAGLFGLPAIPLHPGGDAPGLIIAEADSTETAPAALREAAFLASGWIPDLPGASTPYHEPGKYKTRDRLIIPAPDSFYLLC